MNERTELTRLAERYRAALLDDCVPFWFPRAIDAQHGGFLHCFDRAGQLVDDDKSVWAQGRMSWMLLTLYRDVEPKPEWLQWAESGLAFLDRHAFDDDGRMFFQLARDGTPLRKRRYAFSECFASIAFGVHAQVTGDSKSAARAMTLFEQFVRWNFTPGLMPPKYTSARPMIGLSPRLMTIVTAQELRQSLGSHPALVTWIDRAIDEITRWFLKPDRQCLMETVSPTGEVLNHFDGRTLNPGHALEGAWFLMEEGHRTGRASLIEVGCQILDWMWPRGWDQKYGASFISATLRATPYRSIGMT